MNSEPSKNWHALTAEDTLANLGSNRNGLSSSEIDQRIEKYGLNRLKPPKKRGSVMRFIAQFHNVLIYVLFVAAIVSGVLLNEWLDSAVILGVVIVNTLIGFIQEGKAEKALDAIRNMLAARASVLRGGKRISIDADQLVPGDIVLLSAGDKVSADLRFLEIKNLQIDEAILTGESVPVGKRVEPTDAEAVIGDRRCMAYSGTLVTQGQGVGIVVETGDATEIGRISGMLADVHTLITPLLRQMAQFGRWLTAAILVLAGFTFLYGYLLKGYTPEDMFQTAVGLAVAAIPEGLPAVMTVTLAIGVQRMVRRHSIIRRLPAVETLGSVTVICSDKTGTLTRSEMTVKSVLTADDQYEVTGVGYSPEEGFILRDNCRLEGGGLSGISELLRAAVLCNETSVNHVDGEWKLEGAPTEGALITLGLKAGLDPDKEREKYPRLDVVPFDSRYKFMATLNQIDDRRLLYVKGAPERLLEMCKMQQTIAGPKPLDAQYWKTLMERAASRGQRLLAFAYGHPKTDDPLIDHEHLTSNMVLLGICGIIDPPRPEAIAAIKECHEAGITVKMITGDYELTARAIADELGIGRNGKTVTGAELEQMTDEQLVEVASQTDVFARTSPEHKLRLVQALQKKNHVVAMTGDGVNDAPALKQANVGVAMGKKGTEAAKEASEMVITDDNFRSIVNAVEEGRAVYDNLKKTIMFILPVNGGESLMMLVAVVLGVGAFVADGTTHLNLPITPVQILWVNMMSSVMLALALAFEPMEPGVMKRPPRKPGTPILSAYLLWRIAFVSLLLVTGTMLHYSYIARHFDSIELARAVAVNTLVFGEIAYLFNSRYMKASSLRKESITGNRTALLSVGLLIIVQMIFTYLPPVQSLFGTAALPLSAWVRIVCFAVIVFLLVEAEKALGRALRKKPAPSLASPVSAKNA